MDKFYEHLRKKYFVNYENEEIKDISKAMNEFLNQLRDTFNKFSDVLHIKTLIPCGSMEEKTTIWGEENTAVEYDPSSAIETIEFDCVAVLEPIVSDMEMENSCPGYKRITSQTLHQVFKEKERIEDNDTYKKAMSDHTANIMQTLRLLLTSQSESNSDEVNKNSKKESPSFDSFITKEIAEKMKSNEDITFLQDVLRLHKFANGKSKSIATEFMVHVDDAAEEMCKTGQALGNIDDNVSTFKVDTPCGTLNYVRCLPGCQLALRWESKTNQSLNKIVYADFVPAFQVPIAYSRNTENDPPNYLVAKGCRNSECTMGCWRLSHCLAEMRAIKRTSQRHRDVYKIFKIFNNNLLSRRLEYTLKSYHIKTALLRHISICKDDTVDITECVCQVLSILKTFIENEKVPHWKDPNYFLILVHDTCHSFVPIILQFVFGQAVKHSPQLLYLTIFCVDKAGKELNFYKAGCKISELVCKIVSGEDCYDILETEIENTILKAADLAPYFHQHRLKCSVVVETRDSPADTVTLYQRCQEI